MGANITIKLPKGKDVSSVVSELKMALHNMGVDKVEFNVKRKNISSKYNKPNLEMNKNTLQLF